eukprot:m.81623 g.81623  ORF g.81623 m.81623 type:complete len:563 (-) comp12816_c0_seq2:530-2218(-)
MADSSIIACLTWVPRGVAKEVPDKVELNKEDIQRLMIETQATLTKAQSKGDGDDDSDWETEEEEEAEDDDESTPMETGASATVENEEDDAAIIAKYNLDSYDDDEEDVAGGVPVHGAGMGNGVSGLLYHAADDEDPYITLKEDVEDEEERDDFKIKPTDNMIIVGQTEDVYSHLEIYVYDEMDDHAYVHHDIMLASYPLCLEWLNFDPEAPEGGQGNMVAVGTMSPQIEVWDLDIVDCVEPAFALGDNKRKTKKHSRGHRSEVMCLAWNSQQRNVLASGSADTTVKLWDLAQTSCLRTYKNHQDKVQCIEWNTFEPPVLATGGFDKMAHVFDTRSPEAVSSWKFSADIESLQWSPWSATMFYVSTEDGSACGMDTRKPGQAVFTLDAHESPISALALNPYVPGLLVTASADATVKIWDVEDHKPSLITGKDFGVGPVYTAKFSPDSQGALALGGMQDGLKTINVFDIASVNNHFSKKKNITQPAKSVQRRPQPGEEEEMVYAAGEDPDSDEETWAAVLEDMHITPTEETKTKDITDAPKPNKKKKAGTKGKGKGKGKNKKKR